MSDKIKINELYDLNETIAADYLKGFEYPWEALAGIKEFIVKLGETLPADKFDKIGDDIWVAKSAKVAPTACLNGPLIVDEEAEVRHCAFVRGSAIVGKNSVVGNSTELKNVILFNNVQVPHYNYVGDSILGYKSHMGAGSITSNVKSDKKLVVVKAKKITRPDLRNSEPCLVTELRLAVIQYLIPEVLSEEIALCIPQAVSEEFFPKIIFSKSPVKKYPEKTDKKSNSYA